MNRAADAAVLLLAAACTGGGAVQLQPQPDGIAVACAGEPLGRFLPAGHRRPVVWPLYAPGGVPVTRAFPFAEVAGEPRDHPHHESLWFAHGDVNGVDFWAGEGRIVADTLAVEADRATIRIASTWRDGQGRAIGGDRAAWTFAGGADWRTVDLDLELIASDGELKLGDTKEGTFALRLRPELCLRGEGAGGAILTSEGLRDGAAWGKRARWVAYSGRVAGQQLTVAVFDHPGNPAHPTFWHARDYGLLAANPFGAHDFSGAPAGTGAQVVPAGGSLRFRYRVWIATGEVGAGRLDACYRGFAGN